MRPIVSRDGGLLAYTIANGSDAEIRLRHRSSDQERSLLATAQVPGRRAAIGGVLPGSAFVPDGTALITAHHGHLWRVSTATGSVQMIPFSANVQRELGPLTKSHYRIADDQLLVHAARDVQFSPDGRHFAFSALDRIWLMEPPNGTPHRLTTSESTGEFSPAWSPDGKQLAFVTWSETEGGAVWLTDAAGTRTPTLLARGSTYYYPAFSPDGSSVEAVRDRGTADAPVCEDSDSPTSSRELISLPINGGSPTVIGPLSFNETQWWKGFGLCRIYGRPHRVRKNGDQAIYMWDGNTDLRSWDPAARSWVTRLKIKPFHDAAAAFQGEPLEAISSPDGSYVLVLTDGSQQPYLVSLPTGSATPTTIDLTGKDNAPGVAVGRLSCAGVDSIGWLEDGRPYLAAGTRIIVLSTPEVLKRYFTSSAGVCPDLPSEQIRVALTVPKPKISGSLLLRGARLLTMRGHEIIERGDLLVSDGRISAIGPSGSLQNLPTDVHVLDVSGNTVLPGYVDVHEHVAHSIAHGLHTRQAWRLLIDLAFGVTAIRDPSDVSADLASYADRAEVEDLISPRIFPVNVIIPVGAFTNDAQHPSTATYTNAVLRRWSDFWPSESIKQYMDGGRRTRQLIVAAAKDSRLTPTNEGGRTFSMELSFMIDGYAGFEHGFAVSPVATDVIQLLAKSETTLTQTSAVHLGFSFMSRRDYSDRDDPKLKKFLPAQGRFHFMDNGGLDAAYEIDEDSLRDEIRPAVAVLAAGGCAGLGSHGEMPGLGAHWDLWAKVLAGMPAYDALRVGTICSAESIGHGQDIGSLEVGKLADLQILDKDPLDDIHSTVSVSFVMKGGVLYDANALARIWPKE
jgi:WD40 repeat protein